MAEKHIIPHHRASFTYHVLHTELIRHGVVDHELHLTHSSLNPLEVWWEKGKNKAKSTVEFKFQICN